MLDKNVMRYESQIKINPASINKVNSQFALVDILLCYEGRNRNKTSISKQVIEDNLYSLYGVPIIGEWVTKDDNSEDFGTHGGKIIIDDNGIRYEQTTHAYGFVTKDAVENAKWVTITEKDGHTKHDYLELKGCYVWQKRFEEVSVLLDEDRPQSMEINIKKSHTDNEGYLVIDDFTFSAACILGTDVTPCFESASIGRHYELDSVKSDLDIMMKEYQTYKENHSNKEENGMGLDCSKVKNKLSEFTYKNELGEDVAKYVLICANDTSIGVMDREDFKAYSFDCAEFEGDVVIDANSKKECIYAVSEKPENDEIGFSIMGEIEVAKKSVKTECEVSLAKTYAEEYEGKINEVITTYKQLEADYLSMKAEYEKYKAADEDRKAKDHKTAVDNLINDYAKKIGRNSKFLIYRSKIDYSKSVDEINKELTLIAGEAVMNKGTTKQFSYEPTVSNCALGKSAERYAAEERYGDLLSRFKK